MSNAEQNKPERSKRLKDNLRANLQKRKAQSRARNKTGSEDKQPPSKS